MAMSNVEQHFCECCSTFSSQSLPVQRWVIALSGGVDSVVLLHLAARFLPAGSVRAIHVNHHLQLPSDRWAAFCLASCARLSIPCDVLDVYPKTGSEASARKARLQAIQGSVSVGDVVLMGHHANDQAETILFRLARGTGAKGLTGIPPSRALGNAEILRPLLGVVRSDLLRYAEVHDMEWIEDPSNARDDYDRNYLRHHVIPPLVERWPSAINQITQATVYLRDQQQVLEGYLDADLRDMALPGGGFCITELTTAASSKHIALLRRWFECCTGQVLPAKAVDQLLNQCIEAKADAQPVLYVGEYVIRRYRQGLYCMSSNSNDTSHNGQSQLLTAPFTFWQAGAVELEACDEGFAYIEGVKVVSRAEGMSIKPYGRPTKTLKKLFQEAGVPPWLRPSWPVCIYENEVVAVPGLCVAESWWIKSGEKPAFALTWRAF